VRDTTCAVGEEVNDAIGGELGYYADELAAGDGQGDIDVSPCDGDANRSGHAANDRASCGRGRPGSRASTPRRTRWNITSPGDAATTVGWAGVLACVR